MASLGAVARTTLLLIVMLAGCQSRLETAVSALVVQAAPFDVDHWGLPCGESTVTLTNGSNVRFRRVETKVVAVDEHGKVQGTLEGSVSDLEPGVTKTRPLRVTEGAVRFDHILVVVDVRAYR